MPQTQTMTLTLDQVYALSLSALTGSGATDANAAPVAESIRDAEADGIRNVGLGYLPVYCDHLRCGKVDGAAVPEVHQVAPTAMRVDAANGFCHPAYLAGEAAFIEMTRGNGLACLGLTRSYSAGVVGWFVSRLADAGLVAIAFANTSPLVAVWGGTQAFFGTNPIAFAAPRKGQPPLVIDLSTSATARVNVIARASRGEEIPAGWALDADGKPTTDPARALKGTVSPLGGHKGTALALMVDVLAAGLTGSNWSYEAGSFIDNSGGPPGVGQLFLALSPERLGVASLEERLSDMLAAMTAEGDVRIPGERRLAHRARAARDGVEVPVSLHDQLRGYARKG